MRRLIVTNVMSVDGHYEGPGADVMALPMDHRFDAYNAERLRAADTLTLVDVRSWEDSSNALLRYTTEVPS